MESTLREDTENKNPILIVDKIGVVGYALALRFYGDFLPIIVSEQKPVGDLVGNCVYIPFTKSIPKIPQNTFSSIIVVHNNDKITESILPVLSKEAEKQKTIFAVLTNLYLNQKAVSKTTRVNHRTQVFIAGETLGPFHSTHLGTWQLIYLAKQKNTLLLPGSGLDSLYPVLLTDVVETIVTSLFIRKTNEKEILIFPKHPPTALSVARILANKYPFLTIDFLKKKLSFPSPVFSPTRGVYASLPHDLKQTLEVAFEGSDKKQIRNLIQDTSSISPKPFLAIGFSLIAAFFLPFVTMFILALIGGVLLSASVNRLEQGNIQEARMTASQADYAFSASGKIATILAPFFQPFTKGRTIPAFSESVETGSKISEVIVNVLDGVELFESAKKEEGVKAKEKFLLASSKFRQAIILYQTVSAEGNISPIYKQRLNPYHKIMNMYLVTSDVLPYVLGFEGKKIYLVLFQNNNELRPGGGFIGSYGLLSLDRGEIIDFTIHDVYDADGKLTGHIEPPYPLKEYLGVSHWFLRDSNFSNDFPENAALASYIFNLETGVKVDGVIGVDTYFISALLSATGPLPVQDFDEVVTQDNFATLTQRHAEDGFFPGSTQKKDFLSAVYKSLKEKLLRKEGISPSKLAQVLATALEQKHIVLAFASQQIQKPFTVNGYSSSLFDERPIQSNRFNDYFATSDTNLGVNKVNAYIKRSIDYQVTILDTGEIESLAHVTFKNNSRESDRFGGEYVNYLRFILPKEASLTGVSIDSEEQVILNPLEQEQRSARGEVSRNGIEVVREEEGGKETVGFLIKVPPQETKKVSITYSLPEKINATAATLTYNLKLLKQLGVDQDAYTFSLVYPEGFKALRMSNGLRDEGDKVKGAFFLTTDKEIEVRLGKK